MTPGLDTSKSSSELTAPGCLPRRPCPRGSETTTFRLASGACSSAGTKATGSRTGSCLAAIAARIRLPAGFALPTPPRRSSALRALCNSPRSSASALARSFAKFAPKRPEEFTFGPRPGVVAAADAAALWLPFWSPGSAAVPPRSGPPGLRFSGRTASCPGVAPARRSTIRPGCWGSVTLWTVARWPLRSGLSFRPSSSTVSPILH